MVKKTIQSITKLLVSEQAEIISAVTILMVISLITKIAGMIFLTLVARQFGASKETDLFYLASVVPETITNIILLGAISGSIIPIFVKIKEDEGDAGFVRSFSSTMNSVMLLFALLSAVAAIFSRQLIPLAIQLAQHKDYLTADQINSVVWMMRVMLIPQIILGLSAFVSTGLNIYHRFIVPQLAPLFFNIGKILGIIILVPLMQGSIWGLVWGTFLGAFLHLVIQIPLLNYLQIGFKFLVVDFKDIYFKKVIKLGLPRVISLGVEQFAVIIDSVIAFGLTIGSLTAYQYAIRLAAIPLNLFGASYAIASFPALSKLYAKSNHEEFSLLFVKIVNQIIYLAMPVTVILIVLRVPVVRLVYGIFGGNFTWDDTRQVAWGLLFLSLGLIFENLRSALFRAFYAAHNSIIPFISSMFIVVGGVVTGVLFTNYLSHFNNFNLSEITFNIQYFFERGSGQSGIGGLGLSSSLIFSVEAIVLLFVLYKKKLIIHGKELINGVFVKFLAGIVMTMIMYFMYKGWDSLIGTDRVVPLIIMTFITILAGGLVYIWTSYLFKIQEVEIFMDYFIRFGKRIFRRS